MENRILNDRMNEYIFFCMESSMRYWKKHGCRSQTNLDLNCTYILSTECVNLENVLGIVISLPQFAHWEMEKYLRFRVALKIK